MNSANFLGEGAEPQGRFADVKRFPRLFKKASSGALMYWDVFVQEKKVSVPHPADSPLIGNIDVMGAEVVVMYGQVGTLSPQRSSDTIKEGKNLGKKNETTAFQQAVKEAQSKWEKQKKRMGYVDSEDAARAEEIDALVQQGGVFPMLAEKYRDYAEKIAWPCFVQKKFNGHRCIAVIKNGKATLWTRKRNQITAVPHIIEELEANFAGQDLTLDGELFHTDINQSSPDYKGVVNPDAMTLQELSSIVRAKEPKGRFKMVQYHVYDMISDKKFVDRNDELIGLMSQVNFDIIVPAQTGMVSDGEQVMEMMAAVRAEGYEGLMLRNAEGEYLSHPTRRSKDLLKVKKFKGDQEFEIIGINEGNGNLQGHVGSFQLRMKDGKTFNAKLKGNNITKFLKQCFEDHSLWQGKLLTVEYAELTEDGKPFQPVATAIREKNEV